MYNIICVVIPTPVLYLLHVFKMRHSMYAYYAENPVVAVTAAAAAAVVVVVGGGKKVVVGTAALKVPRQ